MVLLERRKGEPIMKESAVPETRTLADLMAERPLKLDELLETSGLERKVLDAIIHGRYTPSPQQRQRIARALGVEPGQIAWGHIQQVEHMYGHGPQFGRSP
jgi:transcriptional regulator with XRE-family HTH domain